MSRKPNRKIDTEPLEQCEWERIRPCLRPHWQLFYDVLWETGLRAGEPLAAIKTDLADGGIWITREKRRDHLREYIPLSPELYERLMAEMFRVNALGSKRPVHYNKTRIFPYGWAAAWLALREACKKAGVRETIHPHLFRHGLGHGRIGRESRRTQSSAC